MRLSADINLDVGELYWEMSNKERNEMLKILTEDVNPEHLFRVRSLEDKLKVETLQELFKKKTLDELQEFVNK